MNVIAVPKTPAPGKINILSEEEEVIKKGVTVSIDDGPEVPLSALSKSAKAPTTPPQDAQGIETIRQYAIDLVEDKTRVTAAREALQAIEQPWDEHIEVERLEDELVAAKSELKRRRESSTAYMNQSEVVAGIERQAREDKEIMSEYLVGHYVKTHERQVLMNDANGDAREINIKASLGKETKYQTSMDLSRE